MGKNTVSLIGSGVSVIVGVCAGMIVLVILGVWVVVGEGVMVGVGVSVGVLVGVGVGVGGKSVIETRCELITTPAAFAASSDTILVPVIFHVKVISLCSPVTIVWSGKPVARHQYVTGGVTVERLIVAVKESG